jgi:hypothetical protein
MHRFILAFLGLSLMSASLWAQDLTSEGFNSRFKLEKSADGKVSQIKLKRVVATFSIRPFIEQLKSDLFNDQKSFQQKSDFEREAQIDALLADMGLDPYSKSQDGAEEALKVKQALMNVKNIDIDNTFAALNAPEFWKEFEARLKKALDFMDPTIVANLDDSRFFYRRNVSYEVVKWALNEAKKRFNNVPVLSIASFIIVRVHDMMLEQRSFHHNMLLHYFETIPEGSYGMTKEEVDRAVSSIYEYRINATALNESNRAARTWQSYGMDNFYITIRSGMSRVRSWSSPMSTVPFKDIKRLNFGFAEVSEAGARKIYHLHLSAHKFTSKPALAYDYSSPKRVKRNRSLLNIAGVAVGFIKMPNFLKTNVDSFLKSFYVDQVRMEGALVGYFESTGDTGMIDAVYAQRNNFYIVR